MTKSKSSYKIKVSNFVGGFFYAKKSSCIEDLEGNKIVVMHDIIFKGKRSVEWADVETYLKRFVGEEYNIEATGDLIYIGTDLSDEYTSNTNIL